MRATLFNGSGNELTNSWFHVPCAYVSKYLPKGKQLAIIEIRKNKVIVALRSGTQSRIGMMKHIPLLTDKLKRRYFNYKGKKIFIKDVAAVF
jgi:hypothetical protein